MITETNIKISVIIPCYNCETFIDETLDSLYNQSFKDFEIICINDGSNDKTLKKLFYWKEKKVFNINIINQVSHGVSYTRNIGIKAANGKYIMFCDSDDLYHPTMIEKLFYAIENNNTDSAYCLLSRKKMDVFNNKTGKVLVQSQEEAMNNLLFNMGNIGFCCYIYKKILFLKNENKSDVVESNYDVINSINCSNKKNNKDIELLFDENTKFGEDREFNWKYLAKCRSVAFVNEILYWYRPNQFSSTKSKSTWRKTDALYATKRIENYLKKMNCSFFNKFDSYMYARVMWSVAKDFAIDKNKELFKKLIKEYDVKNCMRVTRKDKNILVAFASILFLINPYLFYFALGIGRK